MLIRFWCDSDITFSCGLHKNLVTALYFSIINVLCGGWRRKNCPSGTSGLQNAFLDVQLNLVKSAVPGLEIT